MRSLAYGICITRRGLHDWIRICHLGRVTLALLLSMTKTLYVTPVIVVVGVVGNALSLAVFSLTYLQRLSSSLYLSMLPVRHDVGGVQHGHVETSVGVLGSRSWSCKMVLLVSAGRD